MHYLAGLIGGVLQVKPVGGGKGTLVSCTLADWRGGGA